MFFDKYLFTHQVIREVDVPPEIIMENICDFDHVNFVHKKCFSYNRLIKRMGDVILLEYGVKHIPLLPITTHYILIHEQISPLEIMHYSINKRGGAWIKTKMVLEERIVENKRHTLWNISYERYQSVLLKPFERILIFIASYWGGILWSEDYELCKRRQLLREGGFIDGAPCGGWDTIDGNSSYTSNYYKNRP